MLLCSWPGFSSVYYFYKKQQLLMRALLEWLSLKKNPFSLVHFFFLKEWIHFHNYIFSFFNKFLPAEIDKENWPLGEQSLFSLSHAHTHAQFEWTKWITYKERNEQANKNNSIWMEVNGLQHNLSEKYLFFLFKLSFCELEKIVLFW